MRMEDEPHRADDSTQSSGTTPSEGEIVDTSIEQIDDSELPQSIKDQMKNLDDGET